MPENCAECGAAVERTPGSDLPTCTADREHAWQYDIPSRLEYLRGEIDNERISYSELAELQGLAEYIDPSDVQLLEWAGVPEFPDDDE